MILVYDSILSDDDLLIVLTRINDPYYESILVNNQY